MWTTMEMPFLASHSQLAAGEQGTLSIRHHWDDEDTLIVTIELPEPIKIKMIRGNTAEIENT